MLNESFRRVILTPNQPPEFRVPLRKYRIKLTDSANITCKSTKIHTDFEIIDTEAPKSRSRLPNTDAEIPPLMEKKPDEDGGFAALLKDLIISEASKVT